MILNTSYKFLMQNNYIKTVYSREEGGYPKILVEYLLQKYLLPKEENEGYKLKLLDVGAGKGDFVNLFSAYFDSYGVDREVHHDRVKKCDFENDLFPYSSEEFDIVFTKSTIEHVQNAEKFFSEIYRVLKTNGKVLILLPSWEYNYKWFYDDPTHIKPWHRKGLLTMLEMMNFREAQVEYFKHLPLVWGNCWMNMFSEMTRVFLPDTMRWRNKEETKANIWVRFSKEIQLLGYAKK